VRELENAVKRALVLATSNVLTPADFAFLDQAGAETPAGANLDELVSLEVGAALDGPETGDIYRRVLEKVERPLIERVLSATEGNQLKAAALLGINRNTLRKKISELEIDLPARPRLG
jgi:two-component system nitrogen regulation response regulator GlnG